MEVAILLKIHLLEYLSNENKGMNQRVSNMIRGIIEAKTLVKYTLGECRCKFDSRKCNFRQKSNIKMCQCKCKEKNVASCM